MENRSSGILLHITSLPSSYGIGDLGPTAYRFADFLCASKQTYWQILPINPTNPALGNSPYSSISSFAGNPLLISPKILVQEGLLSEADIAGQSQFPHAHCDYSLVLPYKESVLDRAYRQALTKKDVMDDLAAFENDNAAWIGDYAIFVTIRRSVDGRAWNSWPPGLRDRKPKAISAFVKKHKDAIRKEKFLQYIFFKQWGNLKKYCNEKGVKIFGDLPIYVSFDSVDVWRSTGNFILNKKKAPAFSAGVPPDYFSQTGQLWGNPVYNWEFMKKTGYKWWKERMEHNFKCFDLIRIDHFRGLVAFWQVPEGETTAVNGEWIQAPVRDFFDNMLKHFGRLPIIAEDLGLITDDVRDVMRTYGFTGMKVLLFSFMEDNPSNPYLPHNYDRNYIVYTGTHDNNTVLGWLRQEAGDDGRRRLFTYLGRHLSDQAVPQELMRLAMMSIAQTAIFPLQDVIGLGEDARMNTPSTPDGNWQWRFVPSQLDSGVEERLRQMTATYGRAS